MVLILAHHPHKNFSEGCYLLLYCNLKKWDKKGNAINHKFHFDPIRYVALHTLRILQLHCQDEID